MLPAAFVVVAAVLYFQLPRLPPNQLIGLKARLAVLRRSNAVLVLPLTVLGMAASYVPYACSDPALRALGVAEVALPSILFLYGAGAISGNLATGVATDRYGSIPVLRTCYVGMGLSLAAVWFIGVADTAAIAAAGAASFFWGASTWMQTPAQQQRLITAAPSEGPLLMALHSSAIYVGIGLGTAIGGWAIADLPRSVFGLAAIVAVLALIYLELTAYAEHSRAIGILGDGEDQAAWFAGAMSPQLVPDGDQNTRRNLLRCMSPQVCWFLDAGDKRGSARSMSGVQKTPRHEVAGSWARAGHRALWGFNAGAQLAARLQYDRARV